MNQSETKGTLTEIKNTKRGVNRRLKDAERAHNLNPIGKAKEQIVMFFTNEYSLRDLWNNTMQYYNLYYSGSRRIKRKG